MEQETLERKKSKLCADISYGKLSKSLCSFWQWYCQNNFVLTFYMKLFKNINYTEHSYWSRTSNFEKVMNDEAFSRDRNATDVAYCLFSDWKTDSKHELQCSVICCQVANILMSTSSCWFWKISIEHIFFKIYIHIYIYTFIHIYSIPGIMVLNLCLLCNKCPRAINCRVLFTLAGSSTWTWRRHWNLSALVYKLIAAPHTYPQSASFN